MPRSHNMQSGAVAKSGKQNQIRVVLKKREKGDVCLMSRVFKHSPVNSSQIWTFFQQFFPLLLFFKNGKNLFFICHFQASQGHFWVFKRWDWPNWIKLTPAFMQQKFYCQTCFDIKVSSTFQYQGHFIELREVDTLNRLKAAPLNKNGSLPAFLISLDLWQSNIGSQVRIWKGDIYWQRRFQSW